MWLRQVKMLVKVILVVLSFVQSTTKQFWLELYHMEVDVVKQENQEYMEKSITSKIGFRKVNTNMYLFGYIGVGNGSWRRNSLVTILAILVTNILYKM